MYLNGDFEKYWAIDIEGDPIPSTRIWVMCAVNIKSGEEKVLREYGDIRKFINEEIKEKRGKLIAHNGIGYDFPFLNDILGVGLTSSHVLDTLVYSQLYSPSLKGGHSLRAWGERLNYEKLEFDDFSQFSPQMEEYCLKDTKLCALVFKRLVTRMLSLGFTDLGLEIEHKAWSIIKKQKDNGFAFNIEEAHILLAKLRAIEEEIKEKIYEYWPPELQVVGEYVRPYKKDGQPTANFERHRREFERVEVSEDKESYRVYGRVAFNIASPPQRIEKLLELGWEPKEFTPTNNPKPTNKGKLSPSLREFVETSGREEPRLIARWLEANSRANMINTWIEAYNDDTGCIHGSLWLANTLRYRHSNPNTANIPAVRIRDDGTPAMAEEGAWTYEARDLWTVRSPLRRLVGVDAKGIQLRVLAHYLNNPEFTEAVLNGDPHSYNQEIGGFRTRAIAKTFIYAFLLGVGDAKAGVIVGGTTKDGRESKKRFVSNFPGLEDLLDDLERQVQRTGRIRLCDGTPLAVSQPHTRLGYLLQGDESRIMKKASINSTIEIAKRGLDVLKVGDIHDEWQSDVLQEHVDELTQEVYPKAFKEAGEFFNYRLPIECDSQVGMTWAQTH